MLIFFEAHPTIDAPYKFTNLITGEIEYRTVTERVKRSRFSDVFKCKQVYFEVTMTAEDGMTVTAEYEIST